MTDQFDEAAAKFLEGAFGLDPMDDQPEIVDLATLFRTTHNAALEEAAARIEKSWNATATAMGGPPDAIGTLGPSIVTAIRALKVLENGA